MHFSTTWKSRKGLYTGCGCTVRKHLFLVAYRMYQDAHTICCFDSNMAGTDPLLHQCHSDMQQTHHICDGSSSYQSITPNIFNLYPTNVENWASS